MKGIPLHGFVLYSSRLYEDNKRDFILKAHIYSVSHAVSIVIFKEPDFPAVVPISDAAKHQEPGAYTSSSCRGKIPLSAKDFR